MQTQSIRNPAGWLHAALKNGYTFSSKPHSPIAERPVQPQDANEVREESMSSLESPPIRSEDPKSSAVTETKQKRDVPQILQDYLHNEKGDGGDFAREFLRWRGNEGRASPSP